jgi:hypothetical protein
MKSALCPLLGKNSFLVSFAKKSFRADARPPFLCSCTAHAGACANGEAGPKGERQEGASQEKEAKESTFPQHCNQNASLLRGFFYSPSLANRKTADFLSAALRVSHYLEDSSERKIKILKRAM